MSTAPPVAPLLPAMPITRRPLKSTSVRSSLRPRSSIVDAPSPPPLLTAVLVAAPETDGTRCTSWPIVVTPEASIASRFT